MPQLRARLAEMKAVGTSKPWKRKGSEHEDGEDGAQAEAAQKRAEESAAKAAELEASLKKDGEE